MTALIVARPGTLREALSGLLSAMPEIKVVAVTANLESALEAVAESCPSIILLQTCRPDAEYLAQVQALRTTCPQTRLIALVEDSKEIQACEKRGVDVALVRGSRPSRLAETISELLRSPASMTPQT